MTAACLPGVNLLPAQKAPPSPDRLWEVPGASRVQTEAGRAMTNVEPPDPNKLYTLAELVDLAERHNPETRAAWERAKQKAAAAGIARSALFPTLSTLAATSASRYTFFFGAFYREEVEAFSASLDLSWTILDFGARRARIDFARAGLISADFTFNDTHRRLIFEVASLYYALLDATGREQAAQATLADARTVQQSVEERLANGLATLPDALESRAATAQAQYELASVEGDKDLARGALLKALGISPAAPLNVQDVSQVPVPEAVAEPVQNLIERAMTRRPDLLAQAAQLEAADANIREARSAFYPTLSFSGDRGTRKLYAQQGLTGPILSALVEPYNVQLQLNWTIFDGGARSQDLARARSERREAGATLDSVRDRIENEVWVSYTNVRTSLRRQEAADALLTAASQSYAAAVEAYNYGVRSFLDVSSAQRDLARARTAQVSARTELLTNVAALAFQGGDVVPNSQPPAKP